MVEAARPLLGIEEVAVPVGRDLERAVVQGDDLGHTVVGAPDETAVAGFGRDEIKIEAKETSLVVRGEKAAEDKTRQFLHRGIAARNFERRFQLADYVEVKAADLENGLLHIDLVRNLPERMRPRTIAIGQGSPKQIEG